MISIISFVNSSLELIKWAYLHFAHEFHPNYLKRETKSRPVAIMGNGVSLQKIANSGEIDRSIDYCLVNFSPLSEWFFLVKPQYYVLADDGFFRKNHEVLKEKIENLVKVVNKIDWKITLLVPYVFKKRAEELFGGNKNITIIPFNRTALSDGFAFNKIKYWLFKKGLATPVLMNVGVASLYCLVNLGFSKIYLYGMEHSWIKLLSVDKENRLCMNDVHFYDGQKQENIRYMKLGGRPERLHEQLRFQAMTFASYWDLNGYADYLGGVEIINKTEDSFIDAFKKEL